MCCLQDRNLYAAEPGQGHLLALNVLFRGVSSSGRFVFPYQQGGASARGDGELSICTKLGL